MPWVESHGEPAHDVEARTGGKHEVKHANRFLVGGLVLVLTGLGVWTWLHRPSAAPALETAAAPSPAASSALAVPASASAASGPAINHPIEAATAASGTLTPDLVSELTALFGRKSVLALFQLDEFPRRLAATVDNLGRAHAAARLWPLNPAPGRFLVDKRADMETISADNGLRYTPYVLLIETVDLRQAVATYTRLYPQFQKAFEELGYPGRYFNDRVVEVIDQLLATPDVTQPVKVRLPVITGPIQPARPWLLYEFEDPAFQSLSAGQKILLRMGPVNERRMKSRLAELRHLLTTGTTQR
ncbi:MAG: DUF3014 domain-containing protein [Caldimonas sp.]